MLSQSQSTVIPRSVSNAYEGSSKQQRPHDTGHELWTSFLEQYVKRRTSSVLIQSQSILELPPNVYSESFMQVIVGLSVLDVGITDGIDVGIWLGGILGS